MVSTPSNLLTRESLTHQLSQLAEQHDIQTWCLAYSGGVDSQVLLHLLQSSPLNVYAIYIDHGLQAESASWAKHCEEQCAAYDIPFQCIAVNAHPEKGESPEAAARAARYTALSKIIDEQTCLLTAQHHNDQAETVLLQLLRGAGAQGLSAMPSMQRFYKGWHCRPLIETSQQAILEYAQQQQLRWVEDPSNQQQSYDRNYLRHSVVPVLETRWPALNKTLTQFAQQQVENVQLLEQLAEIDLQGVQQADNSLLIPQIARLTDERKRNLLRYWLKQQGALMPSRAVLRQILLQLETASHDNHSLVNWAQSEVRRFRERLYHLSKIEHDATQCIEFELTGAAAGVAIASLQQRLRLEPCDAGSQRPYVLDTAALKPPLSIRFRQGGERIQPAGRAGHRELKKLFQEADIPGWQRERIPLLYSGENLLAVVGYWLADEYAVKGSGLFPVIEKK